MFAVPMAIDPKPVAQSSWLARAIGSVAWAGVVVFGLLAILWEIVKQPLALIYGLVGLGVGYAMFRVIWLAAGA